MTNTFFSRYMRKAAAILTSLTILATMTVRASAATLLAELDSPRINTGEPITIYLVALNSTRDTAHQVFPATFGATLIHGSARAVLEFKPIEQFPAVGVEIPPNGFARIGYQATLPARASGPARLEVAVDKSPTFAIEITSAQDASETPVKSVASKFSINEAMDRQTPETSFFKRHVFPYEPFYFLAGPDAPGVKFQVSIKYRLVNTEVDDDGKAEGWLYGHAHWMDGLNLAYTQRSLWDIQAESAPFLDSSYMPELLYERPNLIDPEHGWLERIGAQVGLKHESNGKDGADSRSVNIGYVRVPFVFGDEDNFYLSLEPRAWLYVGALDGNPDLADYRGYVDVRLKAGWARGLQVAGELRSGKDFDRGSAQIDVTYPLHNLLSHSFSLYLQAQYFNGYGESLLLYNQRSEIWRVGIGLFR